MAVSSTTPKRFSEWWQEKDARQRDAYIAQIRGASVSYDETGNPYHAGSLIGETYYYVEQYNESAEAAQQLFLELVNKFGVALVLGDKDGNFLVWLNRLGDLGAFSAESVHSTDHYLARSFPEAVAYMFAYANTPNTAL